MSLADGIQLFIQRGHENGGLDAADEAQVLAQSIVEHLDGLLGHRARSCATQADKPRLSRTTNTSTVRDLSDETQGRHERHSTLWAAIEWSWNLIDHELRAARCFSFSERFELRAASALCDLSEQEMRRVLTGLIDSSLLMTREDNDGGLRYYLLETVQEFARLQLGTSPTDAQYRFINFHAAFGHTDSLARIDTKGGAQSTKSCA